jgi:hypothetical protein
MQNLLAITRATAQRENVRRSSFGVSLLLSVLVVVVISIIGVSG